MPERSSCDRFEWCDGHLGGPRWFLYDPGIEVLLHEQKLRSGPEDDSPVLAVDEYRDEATHESRGYGTADVCLTFDGSWQPVEAAAAAIDEVLVRLLSWRLIAAEIAAMPRFEERPIKTLVEVA